MKKFVCLALFLLLLCSATGCDGAAEYETLNSPLAISLSAQELESHEAGIPAVCTALTDFGISLLQVSYSEDGDTPLISPLSVALALSMTANGADGDTLAQFEQVLAGGESLDALNAACQTLTQIYGNLGGSTESSIANSLWVDPDGMIREDFIGRCQGIFGAEAVEARLSDPGIVQSLNSWVSEHTREKISSIISEPFDGDTALLLVNALYLKNTWAVEFDPLDTMEMDFIHEDGTTGHMEFLRHFSRDFPYLETSDAQGVLLPYDDGRLAFFALMPQKGVDFDMWLGTLNGEALAELIQLPQEDTHFLRLSLPKFEAEWKGELNEVLAGLGLELAFDDTQADFSRLGDNPNGYFISQVIHAAKIEVHEKGTEAAAATIVADAAGAAEPPEGVRLDFDRPFLYGIVDRENGLPLFLGIFM